MMPSVRIKDTELQVISKTFYLSLKKINDSFEDVFENTYEYYQPATKMHLSSIYFCLKQLILMSKNDKASDVKLDK
jgi:hypothetical protein